MWRPVRRSNAQREALWCLQSALRNDAERSRGVHGWGVRNSLRPGLYAVRRWLPPAVERPAALRGLRVELSPARERQRVLRRWEVPTDVQCRLHRLQRGVRAPGDRPAPLRGVRHRLRGRSAMCRGHVRPCVSPGHPALRSELRRSHDRHSTLWCVWQRVRRADRRKLDVLEQRVLGAMSGRPHRLRRRVRRHAKRDHELRRLRQCLLGHRRPQPCHVLRGRVRHRVRLRLPAMRRILRRDRAPQRPTRLHPVRPPRSLARQLVESVSGAVVDHADDHDFSFVSVRASVCGLACCSALGVLLPVAVGQDFGAIELPCDRA